MNCQGCAHCKILHYPDDDSPKYIHYCDSSKFYNEDDDTIGDSWRYCKGEFYEKQE